MHVPTTGQLVTVRRRRYVVTDVAPSALPVDALDPLGPTSAQHLVDLTSVDDDGLGEELRVVWEIEPGAVVLDRASLPDPTLGLEDPARFDTFLHAIRWGAISSADRKALQAPFRSGIVIEDYQLDPVARALQMPRVNLLVADDVGLGKTIESGLVVQELLLRHRARSVLVVCPAGLQIHWRDQMREKFGLEFRIIDSEAMRELRRSRGLHVNPWAHFPRLITSIDYLKRERPMRLFSELLPREGEPAYPRRFDLLIVDEAHNVSPSGRGNYALDSMRTSAVRKIARHFEHRLFLSATPHNGFTESFSALLELLDDQRFHRGVPIDPKQLATVMVRRLKTELKNADGSDRFPRRQLVPIEVPYTDDEKQAHRKLVEYTGAREGGARGPEEAFATEFVLKLLKKRLFSSPAGFSITLERHEKSIDDARKATAKARVQAPTIGVLQRMVDGVEEECADDDEYEETAVEAVDTTTRLFRELSSEERKLLRELRTWAERAAAQDDSKAKELVRFLKGVVKPGKTWTDERVIVFTEYRATQKYLQDVLARAGLVEGERVKTLYGGMHPDDREAVKAAFQASPADSEVRILIATDAASEGIDLQNHCHRLVHYEIPWNPNRMEQRNGRIDRHGQRHVPLVHHFVGKGWEQHEGSSERDPGDLEADLEFLFRAARKVETIREDLGSAGDVIAAQVEEAMLGKRRRLDTDKVTRKSAGVRAALRIEQRVREQVQKLREKLEESREALSITPEHLRAAVDAGLAIAGLPALEPITVTRADGEIVQAYRVPALSGSWSACTTGLEHPHTQHVRPIVFDAKWADAHDDVVLAHLNHRLVQMTTGLLRAEAWSSETRPQSLKRVTARIVPAGVAEHPIVVGHARLVVLGADQKKLHEEVIVAGGTLRNGRFARVAPTELQKAIDAATAERAPDAVATPLASSWSAHRDALLEALDARMKDRVRALERDFAERADKEADDIRGVLEELARTLDAELRADHPQMELFNTPERDQFERNKQSMRERWKQIPGEIERETAALRRRYADPQPRLFPRRHLLPRAGGALMAARRQQRAIGPAKQHAEWRSLVEVSGPFLSMEVLTKTFPQGLDKPGDEADVRARLKSALEEWQESDRESIHRAFVRLVLREVLGFDDAIMRQGQAIPGALVAEIREHGERVVPDLVVNNPESETPRLLVSVVHWEQRLESPVPKSKWSASPATRMMELLRATDVKLGLVINGEQWMLVHAPRSETSTFASFYASVWLDEPLTLRAFRSLVGARRLFGVDAGESLEALFAESAKHQHEVTDQLGLQVRRAVEVLIQAIDRIDKDRGRKLLAGVDEKRLYESAVTVMMRLVFLLAAEERKLLLLGNPTYEQHYAISTLREQLRAIADKEGEEVLERRHDAWGRLLATFRAVHGGIVHHDLRLPAYGGSLFDPDRYPFLEGRAEGSKWREGPADPLPINNRAVLHLLEAIQLLQIKIGGQTELQRLSFRALDVEQIGHVYEGLLDHTAKRATTPMLGLVGTKGKDSEVAIDDVEPIRRKGNDELVAFFREATGKSESAVLKGIAYPMRKEEEAQLLAVCDNQRPLYNRVAPYAGLLREDSGGRRVVYDVGSVYVTDGTDRRSSGTHYTPKSLTEPIVQYTLEPLVYVGPAEGTARESWKLKSAKEILALRVCDLAMGSGAFLVQACRYLAARLVEAWGDAERSSGGKLVVTPEGALSTGDPSERPMPRDPDERMLLAMRAVADRCLYGVDRNPMAVEMGKLSLWLSTLQRDRPFTFVDHALRCGDSLLGVIDISQLERFHVLPTHGGTMPLGVEAIRPAIRRAIELRQEIEHRVTETLEDANAKARLLVEANSTTTDMGLVADLLVGAALTTTSKGSVALDDELLDLAEPVRALLSRSIADVARDALRVTLRQRASKLLNNGRDPSQGERRPFHWAIEFPEVFATPRSGFDALVGNPPFKGGAGIATLAGDDYRDLLVSLVAGGRTGRRGQADLAAYFVLRAASLLRVDGQTGLVLVNSVVQGDSRVVAFTHLLTCGYVIVRAVSSSPWPGSAAIEIVVVWMRRGTSSAQRFLDDRPVAFIDSGLEGGAEATTVVRPLAANMGRVFRGAMPYGEGFLLAREDAETLVAREPAARAVVLRYLDGDDVNNRPDQRATRYAIFFGQLSLSEVRARFPEALKIVETRVKPQREALEDNNSTARHRREVWWQFSNTAGALTRALGTSAFALVISRVTAHHFFARVGTDQVFSERLMVCCADDYGFYAVLNSSIHAAWAHRPGSTTHESRLTYLGESYETFALPSLTAALKRIGEDHDHVRGAVGMNRGEGLTRIYNRFHEPNDCAQDLAQLREIQVEMDRAVAIAYGWDGVSLAHGFHHTKQGVRFTISEAARRDILNRLLEVNHHRYEDELKEGLHDKSKKLGRARAAPMDDPSGAPSKPQLSLFGAATATPERGTSETDPNKVLRVLQRAQAPLGKSEILVQAKVADAEWGAAIAALKDAGLVVQEGEKRGARYRAVT